MCDKSKFHEVIQWNLSFVCQVLKKKQKGGEMEKVIKNRKGIEMCELLKAQHVYSLLGNFSLAILGFFLQYSQFLP